jgi:Zn-dependent protease
MIFVFLDLVDIDLVAGLILISAICTALVAGISFHEFSHAYVADTMGDGLPRRMGRVTLNPLAHLEPTGTILMLIMGFGWGKPVPVNPNATRHPERALWMTAAAGPLSNFLVAAVAGLPLKLDIVPWLPPFNIGVINFLIRGDWTVEQYAGLYLSSIVLFSLILGVFNLLPIAPLDGFKVVAGLLPRDLRTSFVQLEPWGPVILLVLILTPILTGGHFGVLFEVMRPIINELAHLFAGIEGDAYS